MSFSPLDGPSVQGILTVTTVEIPLRVGLTNLDDREVITVQPVDGQVYITFVTGIEGFLVYKNQLVTFEATNTQDIFIKAVAGTVHVKIAERS